MAGRSCWRLLAACSLIFVGFVAPTFLRGQDAVDRPAFRARDLAPAWIPPPSLPQPHPVGRDTHAPGANILPRLVRVAGIIFSGRVTSIGRAPSTFGQAPASTSVTFQVEHGMRGASAGHTLTIHEWAGLWTSGERYRVGERVLLFLYAPSRLGLTSPVAGAMGKFAMDPQGRIIMSPQHVATLATDPILSGKTVVPYDDFVQAVRRREE
jgi:hypothetical protein